MWLQRLLENFEGNLATRMFVWVWVSFLKAGIWFWISILRMPVLILRKRMVLCPWTGGWIARIDLCWLDSGRVQCESLSLGVPKWYTRIY